MALFRAALSSFLLVNVAAVMPHQARMLRSKVSVHHRIAGGQAPDLSKVIADARTTLGAVTASMDAVQTVFETANTTGIQLLEGLNTSFDGLQTSLESMKSTAEKASQIPFVSSTDVVEQVTAFVDEVITSLEASQTQLTGARQQFIDMMNTASLQFLTTANTTLQSFELALTKMEALQATALMLVQHAASHSAAEEIWPFDAIFGGRKASPFDQARTAITDANKTLADLFEQVDSINGTIVQAMITGVVDQATAAAQDLETNCLDVVSNLPSTFTTQAAGFCTQATDSLTDLASDLQKYTDSIPAAVEKVKSQLTPLNSLAATLIDAVDQAEELASNVNGSVNATL